MKNSTLYFKILCISLFIPKLLLAQQLESGNYLFQSASTEANARRLLGQAAVAVGVKGTTKRGRAVVSVSEQKKESRVNKSSNTVTIESYGEGEFKIKSSFDKVSGGKLNLRGFGVDANVKFDYVKSIIVSIDTIIKVASFSDNVELDDTQICKTSSGGRYFSGDFLLSKDQGYNFVSRVYQGSGMIKIALQSGGSAGATAAFDVNVETLGGTLKQDSVFFKVVDKWSIVSVETISKNYCKNLKGQPVHK